MAEGHGGHDLGLHSSIQSAAARRCTLHAARLPRWPATCRLASPRSRLQPAGKTGMPIYIDAASTLRGLLLPAAGRVGLGRVKRRAGRVKTGKEELEVVAGQSGYAV